MIRKAIKEDLEQINDIYNQNVSESSVANCHLTKTTREYWDNAIDDEDTVFLVMERADGKLSGWACSKPFSIRENYSSICEVSVYVNIENQNSIVAFRLWNYLLEKIKGTKYRQVVALVLEENVRSSKLLYFVGFTKAMELPEIAIKDGKMINLNLFYKKIETES